MDKPRNEKKATQKQMMFKLADKFQWQGGPISYWATLPGPRNVRYHITQVSGSLNPGNLARGNILYRLHLERIPDQYGRRHGIEIKIGDYPSLEETKSRAELREARYEVKKATMERKNEEI